MAIKHSLTGKHAIVRGKTFSLEVRYSGELIIRKAITAISLDSGAPRITAIGHGLLNGWPAAVFGVKGTKELNAEDPSSLSPDDFKAVTLIDANTIEFNSINAADFTPYVSGGFLVYNEPKDLAGLTCRVKFKDRVGGTVLLSTESADAPKNLITATLDNAQKKILITVPASATESLRKSGVWEAEVADGSVEPVVDPLILVSPFSVTDEVVT